MGGPFSSSNSGGEESSSNAAKPNPPPRKKRKTLSQHRRQRKKTAEKRDEKKANVVVKGYFEVEKIIGVRKRKGKREYFVRWKGLPPSNDTWEPSSNLCDSAHREATKFLREQAARRKEIESSERALGIAASTNDHQSPKVAEVEPKQYGNVEPKTASVNGVTDEMQDLAAALSTKGEVVAKDDGKSSASASTTGCEGAAKGNDLSNEPYTAVKTSLNFRDVERISVHDPCAKTKVTDSRINGIPIVLTGHRGWPQFAARWFKGADDESAKEPLDLSQSRELNIERMVAEIGDESVPILKKNYDENDPIQKEIFASTFLRNCWPGNDELSAMKNLYLHQWQFPLSESAASKLCGSGNCFNLPNEILEEDLLQFWLDRKDNPYQYIFMGGTNTMSKLHKDPGGLEITIAPIIGEKECVLAHRLDGECCLYNLDAKVDDVKADKFPMTAFARLWKTVVKPGEILIMPYGTYHQCRNITPCLSYHRFHLDTVNLRPFLESLLEGDAPEIDHDEIIWNCTTELIDRVDRYVSDARSEQQEKPMPEEITKTIDALRLLRHACQEIANQLERNRCSNSSRRLKKSILVQKTEETHYWPRMVQDIDHTLHDFRFRNMQQPPKFRARVGRSVVSLKADTADTSEDETDSRPPVDLGTCKAETKKKNDSIISTFQNACQDLPKLQPFQEDLVIPDSIRLEAGDAIFVRFQGRQARGTISQIIDQMKAVYVSYEDLPPCFDEFQRFDSIKQQKAVPRSGEQASAIIAEETREDTRTKQAVLCALNGEDEFHRAIVQYSKCATFYRVKLHMGDDHKVVDRWLYRDSILEKVETAERSDLEPEMGANAMRTSLPTF